MLLFSETSKCIFNYMSKNLYLTLVNPQIRICQLSAFFIPYFSIFLLSFSMQKYISYLAEYLMHNCPCNWSGSTNASMTYFLDKFLFVSQRWPLRLPKIFKSLFISCSCILFRILGKLLWTLPLWEAVSWEAWLCHITDDLPKTLSCTTSLHSATSLVVGQAFSKRPHKPGKLCMLGLWLWAGF